ncbi:MAG: (2Fe-2S)-binding protein [Planctomycetes bacterium]|nr:(2Fe-2S)-binding protein [Planctomycetota bacterium]
MKPSDDDKMLCYCRNVRYGEVRASIARTEARSVDEVAADCDAGTGCRTCRPEIEALLEEYHSGRPNGLLSRLRRIFSRL